jgi:ComF family protein
MAAEYYCRCCRAPFLNPAPLDREGTCALCRRGLAGFDSAFSFGFHDGTLRTLVHLFKYEGIRTLRGPLAGLLMRALPRDTSFDAVVPMPMHWRRRWERGFNQADLLASEVARRLALPVARALARRKATAPQAGMSRLQRRRNVAGAFHVRRAGEISGRRLLLVDDVLTTGATAAAASAELKRAGARSVTVLTVTRADRRPLPLEKVALSGESVTYA